MFRRVEVFPTPFQLPNCRWVSAAVIIPCEEEAAGLEITLQTERDFETRQEAVRDVFAEAMRHYQVVYTSSPALIAAPQYGCAWVG